MKSHHLMLSDRTPTHTGLEQRVLARLKRLVPNRGGTIVVGFSGGADSLALSAVLARVAPLNGTAITLVHVDHKLRAESHDEVELAARLAASLGLPFVRQTCPGHPANAFPGVGIEEAARRMRYVALSNVAHDLNADAVAIAHHGDDQAETVLLHLLRGSGLRGAAAMSEISMISIPWWGNADGQIAIQLWRPLLSESRSTVRQYALKTGLEPIEDPSNRDPVFLRNRIRHEVVPLLQSINPDVSAMLGRYASIAGEEDLILDQLSATAFQRCESCDGGLVVASLLNEALPIQRRVIRAWLLESDFSGELSFERVAAVVGLARRRRGGTAVELGVGWSVSYQRGMLTVKNDQTATQRIGSENGPVQEDE
jgi:tRNA(Ile)-lysidine synthase